jgi:hypothetical protein
VQTELPARDRSAAGETDSNAITPKPAAAAAAAMVTQGIQTEPFMSPADKAPPSWHHGDSHPHYRRYSAPPSSASTEATFRRPFLLVEEFDTTHATAASNVLLLRGGSHLVPEGATHGEWRPDGDDAEWVQQQLLQGVSVGGGDGGVDEGGGLQQLGGVVHIDGSGHVWAPPVAAVYQTSASEAVPRVGADRSVPFGTVAEEEEEAEKKRAQQSQRAGGNKGGRAGAGGVAGGAGNADGGLSPYHPLRKPLPADSVDDLDGSSSSWVESGAFAFTEGRGSSYKYEEPGSRGTEKGAAGSPDRQGGSDRGEKQSLVEMEEEHTRVQFAAIRERLQRMQARMQGLDRRADALDHEFGDMTEVHAPTHTAAHRPQWSGGEWSGVESVEWVGQ